MKKLSIYWLLVVIFVDEGDFGCHGQQKEESFALGGYLPDYRVGNFDANASAPFLTDLMLFSIQPHSRGMVGGCCLDSSHFEKAREAKALNNDMRLWVTVGGGGRSDAFPEIAANEIKTKRLVDSMIRLCQRESVQGIDLDVYLNVHPVSFLRFLEQASNTWHSVGLQISMTLRPNQQLPLEAYRHLDRIHFMTYDMITKQGQHHAEMENVKKAVLQILSQGCPPEKLLLGIPAYSRHATRPENVQTFAEIYDAVNGDLTALKRGELAGYQFDTLEHVRQKMQFAYDQNLRGVFFWELGQDKQQPPTAGGVLLETAAGKRNELLVSGNKNQDRDEL